MARLLICLAAMLTLATAASAHFPWIYTTDDSEPRMFFGEGLDDREYHVPESIAAAEVWQDAIDAPAKQLTMEEHEEDGFMGIESEDAIEPRGVVRTTVVYGVYHGSKLTYHAQHFPAEQPQAWPTQPATENGLAAVIRVDGEQLVAQILHNNEPLAGADATLTQSGSEEREATETDDTGVARFPLKAVADGLNGIMVMYVDEDASGEIDGEEYSASMQVLTATFNFDREAASQVAALPPAPEAVASFGAAVTDGWLYVYSGHIGQAHDHSRDNLSKHFRRIRVDGSSEWEELPMEQPLQGLAMVPHDEKLYRVGGLDARNASGEKEDLHSVDTFSCYNPASAEWTSLTPLPNPRSSHNAVVLDGRLYVVGGWALSGSDGGDWQTGAIVYDINNPSAGWTALPEPPFKRRALAAGHVDGLVAVLCGMTDDADLSKQVFFYDPEQRAWSEGPEFPGDEFHGFGLSAWNLDGQLYAGGMEGVLYRLSDARDAWIKTDEFATRRFFHQLVPDEQGGLLAVAGASPELGHTGTIERLDLEFAEFEADSDADDASQESTTATSTEAKQGGA